MTVLRETNWYRAETARRGVRITVKDQYAYPKSRVVSATTWNILKQMNDTSFNSSCVLELGIRTYASGSKHRRRASHERSQP